MTTKTETATGVAFEESTEEAAFLEYYIEYCYGECADEGETYEEWRRRMENSPTSQTVVLDNSPTSTAISDVDALKDVTAYEYDENRPHGCPKTGSTFNSFDAKDVGKWDKLWLIDNKCGKYDKDNREYRYEVQCRIESLGSTFDVTGKRKERLVHFIENTETNGYNRYHGGLEGAIVGFCMFLYTEHVQHLSIEERINAALNSPVLEEPAVREFLDYFSEKLKCGFDGLLRYTFKKASTR